MGLGWEGVFCVAWAVTAVCVKLRECSGDGRVHQGTGVGWVTTRRLVFASSCSIRQGTISALLEGWLAAALTY